MRRVRDHGGIIFEEAQLHDLRQVQNPNVDRLRRGQQRDQVAAAGHPLARDEAVLLGIGVETTVGPAAHRGQFSCEIAHNLADLALAPKARALLDLFV